MIEDRYHAALSDIPEDEAKERGKAIGAACARSNLEKRANDGHREAGPPFSEMPIYTPGTAPGDYQFTPPYDEPPFGSTGGRAGLGKSENVCVRPLETRGSETSSAIQSPLCG